MVYVILDSSKNHIKIGVSNNPNKRLATIQTSCSNPLKLIHVQEGNVVDENRIHAQLKQYRLKGEWFDYNLCKELLPNIMKDWKPVLEQQEPKYITFNSDEGIFIDSKALAHVSKLLSNNELSKVLKIADTVKTPHNILYDEEGLPHTPESLSVYIEFSINKFYTLMKKLVKKGIMAYVVCAPSGYVRKVYMLNPTFIRKGKKFNVWSTDIFPDLSK